MRETCATMISMAMASRGSLCHTDPERDGE